MVQIEISLRIGDTNAWFTTIAKYQGGEVVTEVVAEFLEVIVGYGGRHLIL